MRLNRPITLLVFTLVSVFFLSEGAYRAYKFWKYYHYNRRANPINPLIESVDIEDKQVYRLKPSSSFTAQSGVNYKINSKGLRDYEYDYNKAKDVYRILALGDSHIFGWEVKFEDSFPKVLERILGKGYPGKKFEVINAGIFGFNSVQEYEFLKNEAIRYSPDLVILGFTVNDMEPSFEVTQNPVLQYEGVNWWFPEFVKYRLNILIQKLFKKTDYFKLRRQGFSYHYWDAFEMESERWKKEECLEAVGNMQKFLKERHVKFLIFIYPNFERMKTAGRVPRYEGYRFKMIDDEVKKFCRSKNIAVIDIYSAFKGRWVGSVRKQEKMLYSHPNERGQAIAAGEIFKYLKDNEEELF